MPQDVAQRVDYETVRANAEVIVPRTVAIDDAVRAHPDPQLVILGAGLDGRAWRMPELAGAAVFEVDQPASQQDKRDRAAGLPGIPPAYVPVDFGRDRLGEALAAAGHRADRATTWIWEGVVPYLTRAEVAATVAAIAACSAPGSRLIVNFQMPGPLSKLGRLAARALAASAGRSSVWATSRGARPGRPPRWPPCSPVTASPSAGTRTCSMWRARWGCDPPRRSLGHGRVMVADRG